MSHGHILRALKEFGVMGTLEKLQKMRTLKFGALIGVDQHGNKYFENTVDYPHGQHRWVEYAGDKNVYEVDSSWVPPEWHGWLHSTTLEPPTRTTVGSVYKTSTPIANAWGSSAPYARNLGGVISKHTPNLSSYRPRGFGLANGVFPDSKPNQELYYTQPGFPTDKRNGTRFTSQRRSRVSFSLRDTPATLKAKAAAREGLSLAAYTAYSDSESPTAALLQLTGGQVGPEELRSSAAQLPPETEDAALLLEGIEGLPTDAAARQHALALSQGQHKQVAFWADLRSILTPAEVAYLDTGAADEAALQEELRTLDKWIADYERIPDSPGVAEGLESAREKREAAAAQLALARSVSSKVSTLTAKYDAAAFDMAREALQRQTTTLA